MDRITKSLAIISMLILSSVSFSYYQEAQAIPIGTTIRALVYDKQIVNVTGNNLFMGLYIIYFGNGQKDLSYVTIQIVSTDGPLIINNKLVNAVVADSVKYGYVLSPSDVIFERWARGLNVL